MSFFVFSKFCFLYYSTINFFHDHVMVILILITILVGYVILSIMFMSVFNRVIFEGQELESVWTLLPALFLLVIAFPSLKLLYLMEEFVDPDITVKAVGHQWFWSYEYSDIDYKEYDSYMIPDLGGDLCFRLLEVDNSMILPENSGVRVVVTSSDVIHSWTVPAFGVKVDGIPGRLNNLYFFPNRPGYFFGQCSEICGANHSFMPIVVVVEGKSEFLGKWV